MLTNLSFQHLLTWSNGSKRFHRKHPLRGFGGWPIFAYAPGEGATKTTQKWGFVLYSPSLQAALPTICLHNHARLTFLLSLPLRARKPVALRKPRYRLYESIRSVRNTPIYSKLVSSYYMVYNCVNFCYDPV
jgi:hypothetical protein